jgi:hypothetical protein
MLLGRRSLRAAAAIDLAGIAIGASASSATAAGYKAFGVGGGPVCAIRAGAAGR